MKRLSSYFIYPIIVGFPLIIIALIYTTDLTGDINSQYGLNLLILLFTIYYVFCLLKYKRVYILNRELYIYALFSGKYVIVTKQNLVSIGRLVPIEKNNYKIKYIDDNDESRSIWFFKNFFVSDLKAALEDLE